MKIYSVTDKEFSPYGKVIDGYDTCDLMRVMNTIEMPASGTAYVPGIPTLENCSVFNEFQNRAYGGMPIQIGMCWGHNLRLNCLEYHRDSELNIGSSDFILLLAKEDELEDGKLDTAKVKAFRAPAGAVVEVYATTLHYAPCQTDDTGFRTAVILPKGTNTEMPVISKKNWEDRILWAKNKWLLAHQDSEEASQGAYIGLKGENICL